MRLVSLKWAPCLCWARTTRATGPWEDSRELELQDQHLEDTGPGGVLRPRPLFTWRCECLLLTIPV